MFLRKIISPPYAIFVKVFVSVGQSLSLTPSPHIIFFFYLSLYYYLLLLIAPAEIFSVLGIQDFLGGLFLVFIEYVYV